MSASDNRYKELDREHLSENMKRLAFIAIVVVFLTLTYFSLPQNSKVVVGTAETMSASLTEEGNKIFWMVRLDTGELVRVYVSNLMSVQKYQRVEVAVIESALGTTKYRLSRILDEDITMR